MTRLEANREILGVLADFLEKHPDQRFGQALINVGALKMNDKQVDTIYDEDFWYVSDCVFTESEVTLRNIKEGVKRIEDMIAAYNARKRSD